MTPQQRAQLIAKGYCEGEFTVEKYSEFIQYVAAQIEEAERDAKDSQQFELYELHHSDGTIEKWSGDFEKRIKAEAYEDAAKIAEEANQPFVNWNAFTAAIAHKIRQRAKELK